MSSTDLCEWCYSTDRVEPLEDTPWVLCAHCRAMGPTRSDDHSDQLVAEEDEG